MQTETKLCRKCGQNFSIEPEDFAFYEKMKVPPPTLCPSCRLQRRMSWRNDWHVFYKTDALTGKKIFSSFSEESPVKIYDRDYWWSDNWDPMDYGRDYDFSRPFFEQFAELFHTVPLPANPMFNMVNCKFCTNANDCKNCYLVRGASYTEDCAYLIWDQASKDSFDSHMTDRCERGYGNVNAGSSYRALFCVDCENCVDVILSKDCVGCTNCVGCVGLRNQSNMIFNQQYSKEAYATNVAELNIGSYTSFEALRKNAYDFWKTAPQKYLHGLKNVDVSGDYIYESKNAHNCFRVRGAEDSKYIQNILTGPVRDAYDYANYGDNVELVYESLCVGSGVSNVKFTRESYPNIKDTSYSQYCNSSSDLFGCIGLRNKQYCILNKQYSKADYEALVTRIIEHMKGTGEYGEFFPSAFSPYPYQATAAYEFFPLSDDEIRAQGFVSYPIARQEYRTTLTSNRIPDDIRDVSDTIMNEVLECVHKESCTQECTGAFRVIESEVKFCRELNIPLPRLCPNCRHYERLQLRNAPKLYHRQCAKCQKDIETSYATARPEIVYCESCYQAEVV